MIGAAACPQHDARAQNFCSIIYYVIQPTNVESFDFVARLILEI